ncbi:MAG: hypothetical protein WC584_00240 [Candidatus Pacearchaeota archaeon]
MEMKTKTIIAIAILLIYVASIISFASAILVDADYITIYPGEQGNVKIKVENNENFDIESVSVGIVLSTVTQTGEIVSLPFSVVGSSEKSLDDLNEDDDDSATFTIKASTDIKPGDYNIPYVVKYTNIDTEEKVQKQGSFGIRVSAKTDLDFGVEVNGANTESAIVGQQGKITLEIINRGLGDLKSVSVVATPNGYDLISKEKVFVGTVSAEDSDTISWDVLFKTKNPTLNVVITYNDFDNKAQTKTISLPLQVYTRQEALQLGLIKKSNTGIYVGVIIILIIVWFVYRKIKKSRKKKAKEQGRN